MSDLARIQNIAKNVGDLPSDTRALRGIKGVMLGALYSLKRADELGYQPRTGNSIGPDYDNELVETGAAISSGTNIPHEWLAGFYWGSTLWRLAAVYERSLRLILNDYNSTRFNLENQAINDGVVSEDLIIYLRKVFQDTNKMKHADGSLLKLRNINFISEATIAAEKLLVLLEMTVVAVNNRRIESDL